MEYETNPVKAIRKKCLDCCMGQQEEVKQCPVEDCDLYPFRFGKNPFRQKVERNLTDEQKEELRSRLAEARKNRGKNKE